MSRNIKSKKLIRTEEVEDRIIEKKKLETKSNKKSRSLKFSNVYGVRLGSYGSKVGKCFQLINVKNLSLYYFKIVLLIYKNCDILDSRGREDKHGNFIKLENLYKHFEYNRYSFCLKRGVIKKFINKILGNK